MKRVLIPLILFLLVVLEGVLFDLVPPFVHSGAVWIISHIVLGFLILTALYYDKENTYYSVLYAVIFGLLIDIVYTEVLGVYMFTYGLCVYVIHGTKKLLHEDFNVMLLLGTVGFIMADVSIYVIYTIVGIADISFGTYILNRLPATVASNLIVMIVLYFLFRGRLEKWGSEQLVRSRSM